MSHAVEHGARAASRTGRPPTAASSSARPRRAVAGLGVRLVRRGTVVLSLAVAAWLYLEVASYNLTYPDGVPLGEFELFLDNPAVRMLQGVPTTLDNAGAFAAYDAGWMLALLVSLWGLLTSTRLLRGEEESERTDLLLTGPLPATTATWLPLAAVGGAAVVVGSAAVLTMGVAMGDWAGSALLGLAIAGVAATFAGVGAVTSQLVEVRRRAAGIAAGALGVAYLVRMFGNSTDGRGWARWATPLGWFEVLDPYGTPDARALVLLILAPVALVVVAVVLRRRRDTGAGLLAAESGRTARLRLLGGATAFAWRSGRLVLLAWAIGLALFAAVFGGLLATMIDFLRQDETYVELMETFGLSAAFSLKGFLAITASFLGVAIALQAAWRIGAVRAEEETGRAEALLSRVVGRPRWLGGHVLLALLGSGLLMLVTGAAQWVGIVVTGSDEVSLWQATASVLNVLPVVVLVTGIAVSAFGLLPRLTVVLPATVTGVGYVLTLLGPALDWPSWALNLSPFTHLALVPAEPWAATSGLVMTGLGLLLVVVGMVAFQRRDLVGS